MTTTDLTLALPDGRMMGYADYGERGQPVVLWCHGGPGSRLEPSAMGAAAAEAGLRVIGIDRPGYGLSTPQPGRTIAGWVPDALALADHLGAEQFATVGVSTGGSYALACATLASDRVDAVVACCALTDMRWQEGKAAMRDAAIASGTTDIWSVTDRDEAMRIAAETFGEDGSKMATLTSSADGPGLPEADMAMLMDPVWGASFIAGFPAMFAQGVQGYADDRLADGPGWGSFDVDAVRCPVRVIHGESDTIVPVAQAHHTASIVPGAELRTYPGLGHFSIIGEVLANLLDVLKQ
jgi:pimeloyl-ACP methyl ester carboxylesterase